MAADTDPALDHEYAETTTGFSRSRTDSFLDDEEDDRRERKSALISPVPYSGRQTADDLWAWMAHSANVSARNDTV